MRFVIAFCIALTGALAANLTILGLLRPLVVDPARPLNALSAGPVSVFTTAGLIGATLVYASMRLLLRNPNGAFVVISVIILVLSLIPDYLIIGQTTGGFAGATWGSAIVLMLMHIAEAPIVVWALVKLWGRREASVNDKSI